MLSFKNLVEDMVAHKLSVHSPETIRDLSFGNQVVIVDGQGGCGKTLFSSVIAAFDRVELLTYAYELEWICTLWSLKKIDDDAAVTMARSLMDLQIYNTMMGREINFRPSDLSSALRNIHPWRYIKRIFMVGDEAVPERIERQQPILHLTTHNLLGMGDPVFKALGNRLVFIDVARHPLYMLKQMILNMENLYPNVRNFTLHFNYKGQPTPYYALGWEELFIRSNNEEKAIYKMQYLTKAREAARKSLSEKYRAQLITIPFECFVINPWPYMDQMAAVLGSRVTEQTKRMLKKQNVPRKAYAKGVDLKIYRRCGWQPPVSNNENEEFAQRRQLIVGKVSTEALQAFDQLCIDYEEKYLGGKKDYPRNSA